jgi:hypothetical protein
MKTYTIKNDKTHGDILLIDGKESICPYKPAVAMPAQNSLGQMTMQLITFPCCTSCPHAITEKFGVQDSATYTITCNGTTIEFNLNDLADDQPPIISII